jgi:hypothetical protein
MISPQKPVFVTYIIYLVPSPDKAHRKAAAAQVTRSRRRPALVGSG